MNTFIVIKHSSKIRYQSGRQFPLQSYVLLRASMGLGLNWIFWWLIRSGVYYSCKYFCVQSFELGSSRKAKACCLITVAHQRDCVLSLCSLSPPAETSVLPLRSWLAITSLAQGRWKEPRHLLYPPSCHYGTLFFLVLWSVKCHWAPGNFTFPWANRFMAWKDTVAANYLVCHLFFFNIIWFSYFCFILSSVPS